MAVVVAGTSALLALTCPGQGQAQPVSAQLTAAQAFALADERASVGAMSDALTLYDALAGDADPEVRAEARYRKGLLLADHNRYAEAATAFRALLDEKPDAVAGRLELARMLAALGRESDARRIVRQAQAAGLPAESLETVNQFAAALRSQRPRGGSFEVGVAPDSNVNRATQARTLDTIIAPLTLSEDARQTSGLGLRTSSQGFLRFDFADSVAIVTRASSLGLFYDGGAFDDVSASALVGIEWRGRTQRLNASIGRTHRWFGGDPYARTSALTADWSRPLTATSQISVAASAARATYDRNPLQDGLLFDVTISYERALSAQAGVVFTAASTRQSAVDPGYATSSGGMTAATWRETPWGTAYLTTGVRRTIGDERLFLFPERRKDWLVSVGAGYSLRRVKFSGFSPTVKATVERNWSSVGVYEYRRTALEIGLIRSF